MTNMNAYLTIMATVLVLTQIIRITQNAIQLRRQEKAIARDLAWLKDRDITERDFDCQREVFYLLREELRKRQMNCMAQEEECDNEDEIMSILWK